MSFIRLPKSSHRTLSDHVTCALVKPETRAAAHLRITIGEAVRKRLGWEVKDKAELLWGEGPDAGRLMIAKVTGKRGVTLHARNRGNPEGSLGSNFADLPGRAFRGEDGRDWRLKTGASAKTQRLRFKVEAGRLVLDLPEDWWEVRPPTARDDIRAVAGRDLLAGRRVAA